MATTFKSLSDRAVSTLASGISGAVTSIPLQSGDGALFPSSNFWVTVEDEIMLCSSRTTDTLTVTRGQLGTANTSHDADSDIALNIVTQHFDDITAAINTAESEIDALEANPVAHASRHQNGGADEVNVGGLSGVLADDQHVIDAEVDLRVAAAIGVTVQAYDSGLGAWGAYAVPGSQVMGKDTVQTVTNKTISTVSNTITVVEADISDLQSYLLPAAIGVTVQAYDAELAALAGLTSAANKVPRFTGAGTAGLLDFLDEDAMTSNSETAVPSQQSVKAYVDSSTGGLGALIASSNLSDVANAATSRSNLGLEIGVDVIAFDTSLNTIAVITPTADNFIVGNGAGSAWEGKTPAQARTSMGVDAAGTDNSTNVTLAGSLDYATIAGQEITLNAIVLTTDVSGILPVANGGTGAASLTNLITLATHTTGNFVKDITAGSLVDVSGGGSEDATVTVNVDLSELTTSTSDADGDFFVVVDSVNAQKKLTKANIALSGFNNDSGWTTNVGDITGVTAGNDITGGGTSGTVTITLDTTLTTVTSMYNASLHVGRDAHNHFDFSTDNAIKVAVNAVDDEFRFVAGGAFHADGDVVAYSTTTASDRRLKKNIRKILDPIGILAQIDGVRYDWKDNARGASVGVIAQDVQMVLPELVKEVEGLKDAGNHLTVNYDGLVGVLIEAVNELAAKVGA